MPHRCRACTRPLTAAPWRFDEGRDETGVHWVCPTDTSPELICAASPVARSVDQFMRRRRDPDMIG